jgi:hypothetical protein
MAPDMQPSPTQLLEQVGIDPNDSVGKMLAITLEQLALAGDPDGCFSMLPEGISVQGAEGRES